MIQQEAYFAFFIFAYDAPQVAYVVGVHADQVVVFIVIGFLDLHGTFAGATDAVTGKDVPGRRVHGIADAVPDLFGAGGGGGDVETGGDVGLGD